MLIRQIRSAQIVDAIANFVIAPFAGLVGFLFFGIFFLLTDRVVYANTGHLSLHAAPDYMLGLLPLYFIIMGLSNLYRVVKPAEVVFDSQSVEFIVDDRRAYPIKNITALNIAYTGFRSPSRYTLQAVLVTGKPIAIESSGYFGSRQELVDLSHLIADFTKRIDLYAR